MNITDKLYKIFEAKEIFWTVFETIMVFGKNFTLYSLHLIKNTFYKHFFV